MRALLYALILVVLASQVQAGTRSAAQILAFKRSNPCPSTGARRGSCPGYVVDHVYPLCAGGADDPANMQWQTRADSLRKDIQERRLCRELNRR